MKRALSLAEALEAAALLFDLNTGREALTRLADSAGLLTGSEGSSSLPGPLPGFDALWLEWAAFVHAAVLYGLMASAPNVVVLEYLRGTRARLASRDIPVDLDGDALNRDALNRFVDEAFSPYAHALLEHDARRCPALFFRHYLGKDMAELPEQCVALVSATMAMVLAAVTDKLEQYEFLTE